MTDKYVKQIKSTSDNLVLLGQRLKDVYGRIISDENADEKEEICSIHYGVEREALNMRSVFSPGKHDISDEELDEILDIMDISCEEEQNWLKITIPMLMPRKTARLCDSDYIVVPLRRCLEDFQKEDPMEKFVNCVIAFVHYYDVTMGEGRVNDYDNIEIKFTLDVIEKNFIENDSGLNCALFHMSKYSDRDKTEIYIMDPSRFERWLKDRN